MNIPWDRNKSCLWLLRVYEPLEQYCGLIDNIGVLWKIEIEIGGRTGGNWCAFLWLGNGYIKNTR